MDCALEINIERVIEWTCHSDWKNEISTQNGTNFYFKNIQFDFQVNISTGANIYYFEECLFTKGLTFETAFRNESQETTNHYEKEIYFYKCKIDGQFVAQRSVFDKNFRLHNCCVENLILKNATFNALADFWLTKFNNGVTFYKTDFQQTAVFSMATFRGNVLFTYALFAGKTIFARTKFKKGLDLSQAIISGDLQPFDLQFNFKEFKAEYVGKDDETFQNYVDRDAIIPLVNKVHTFQVLKKSFEDIGNYSDSILMQREEKSALKELINKKLKDKNSDVNKGDKWILRLNRLSNHYQSDFRNGIWFTLGVTIIFGFLTLVFTEEFQRYFCWGCEFNKDSFIKGVKFLFNFLNPARRITYLDSFDLRFYGIAYLFDFFGRMAVGYGIYQTIQAFRKFK